MTHNTISTRIGVDIGGTTIKAGIVDTDIGSLVSAVVSLPTPSLGTPKSIAAAVISLVDDLNHPGVVGCALPGIINEEGLTRAPNLAPEWRNHNALQVLNEALERPIVMLNDADAVGLAELRFALMSKHDGLEIVLTFGTGIGSALLHHGILVTHTELGELTGAHGSFEAAASASVIGEHNLSYDDWARRAQPYFTELEALLNPQSWIIGGGLSTQFADYFELLTTQAPIRIAHQGEHAGIVGAASVAAELPQSVTVEEMTR